MYFLAVVVRPAITDPITDPITDLRKQSVALFGKIVQSKTEKRDTQ
jgi:hypothetical protein